MFYLFFVDLCIKTAMEDKNYKGFNQVTIDILDVHEFTSGWFAVNKKEKLKEKKVSWWQRFKLWIPLFRIRW